MASFVTLSSVLTLGIGTLLGATAILAWTRCSGRTTQTTEESSAVRSAATGHAIKVIREVFAFADNIADRIDGHDDRFEGIIRSLELSIESDRLKMLSCQPHEIMDFVTGQRELFTYLRNACGMIQQNSQCIESYVTDA